MCVYVRILQIDYHLRMELQGQSIYFILFYFKAFILNVIKFLKISSGLNSGHIRNTLQYQLISPSVGKEELARWPWSGSFTPGPLPLAPRFVNNGYVTAEIFIALLSCNALYKSSTWPTLLVQSTPVQSLCVELRSRRRCRVSHYRVKLTRKAALPQWMKDVCRV